MRYNLSAGIKQLGKVHILLSVIKDGALAGINQMLRWRVAGKLTTSCVFPCKWWGMQSAE